MTRCVGDGWSHDFPVENSAMAHCEEHGVRLVWKDPSPLEAPAGLPLRAGPGVRAGPREPGVGGALSRDGRLNAETARRARE